MSRLAFSGWTSGLCAALVLAVACGNALFQEERQNGPLGLEHEYRIEPAVKASVEHNTSVSDAGSEGRMDVELFENDSSTFSSFGDEKPLMAFTRCWSHGDTTTVIGALGLFVKSGYRIDLVKDRFSVFYFTGSDIEMYKLNKADTTLSLGIAVPAIGAQVTLTHKPSDHPGEEILGIVDLLSEDFYEVGNNGEAKDRIRLRAYFRVRPSKDAP